MQTSKSYHCLLLWRTRSKVIKVINRWIFRRQMAWVARSMDVTWHGGRPQGKVEPYIVSLIHSEPTQKLQGCGTHPEHFITSIPDHLVPNLGSNLTSSGRPPNFTTKHLYGISMSQKPLRLHWGLPTTRSVRTSTHLQRVGFFTSKSSIPKIKRSG